MISLLLLVITLSKETLDFIESKKKKDKVKIISKGSSLNFAWWLRDWQTFTQDLPQQWNGILLPVNAFVSVQDLKLKT